MKEIFQSWIINNKSSSAQYKTETQVALWLKILVINFYKLSGHITLSRLKTRLNFFFNFYSYCAVRASFLSYNQNTSSELGELVRGLCKGGLTFKISNIFKVHAYCEGIFVYAHKKARPFLSLFS